MVRKNYIGNEQEMKIDLELSQTNELFISYIDFSSVYIRVNPFFVWCIHGFSHLLSYHLYLLS